MSGLKKVTVEDRGGIMRGWQGTKLEHLHKVEGEIILEDSVTGEALAAIENHQLVIAVQGRAGDDWKWWDGGLWIDLSSRPNFDFNHWITLIRIAG